jgi:hypothetical protein
MVGKRGRIVVCSRKGKRILRKQKKQIAWEWKLGNKL